MTLAVFSLDYRHSWFAPSLALSLALFENPHTVITTVDTSLRDSCEYLEHTCCYTACQSLTSTEISS